MIFHCCPVNCQRHESDTFINGHHPHGRFLLLQNLHFHRPWWSAEGVEPPWMALRRVDDGRVWFMSLISATLVQACYISLFR